MKQERQALFGVFDEARRKGVKLDVDVFQEGRPSGTSEATPLGRALSRHVRAVTGKAPKFEMCPGLLEIRFYAEQGMPAYAYGPGLLSISHGPKEFVDTNRIVECAAIYARVAATGTQRVVSARANSPNFVALERLDCRRSGALSSDATFGFTLRPCATSGSIGGMENLSNSRRSSFGSVAIGAAAIGAVEIGAFAIGALAIGRLAIRRFAVTANARSVLTCQRAPNTRCGCGTPARRRSSTAARGPLGFTSRPDGGASRGRRQAIRRFRRA